MVPWQRPSQLKPSNHLKDGENRLPWQRWIEHIQRTRKREIAGCTCVSECPSLHSSDSPAARMDCPWGVAKKRSTPIDFFELFVKQQKKQTKKKHWNYWTSTCSGTGRVKTCKAAWQGWLRSWRSFWGTRSCLCPAGWCCMSSWDQNLKKEGWEWRRVFKAEQLNGRIQYWDLINMCCKFVFFCLIGSSDKTTAP